MDVDAAVHTLSKSCDLQGGGVLQGPRPRNQNKGEGKREGTSGEEGEEERRARYLGRRFRAARQCHRVIVMGTLGPRSRLFRTNRELSGQ